ncbi:MAG: MarR family transcriptional regulator [Clostridia bacterium]|nr:MarR family transcriptional regulator [Clostridia bacterium]
MDQDKRHIARELHRLEKSIGRHFCKHKCTDEKTDEITGTNMRIIRFLESNQESDIYQKDVEKEFGITRSTASRVLVLMEEKGLVKRLSVDHDGRLKKLILTEKSLAMGKAMRQVGEKTDERLLEGFTEDEKEQLFSFIDRMMENISRA